MADSEISQHENAKLSERRMLKKLAISKIPDQDESQDLVEKYIALSPQRKQIKKQLTMMHQKQRVDDDRLVDWVQYKQEIGSPPNPYQINDFICEMELKKDAPISKIEETKALKDNKLPELPQRPKTQSPKRGNQTIPNLPEPGAENYFVDKKPPNEKELQSFKDRQNFKRISFQSYKKGGSNLKKISNSLIMNQNNSITSVENTNPSPPLSPEKGKPQGSIEISNMANLRTAFVQNHRNFVIKEVEKEVSKNDSNYRLPVLSKLGRSENLDRLNRSENSRIRLKSAMKQSTILLDEDKKAFSPSKSPNKKQSLFKDASLMHIEMQGESSPQPDQQNNASIDSPNPYKNDVKIPLRQILSSIRPGPGGHSPIPFQNKNPKFPSRPIKFLKSNTYGYTEQSPIIRNSKTNESGIFTSKLELPSPVTPNKFNFILTGLESNKKTGRSNKSSENRFSIARKELSRSLNYDVQERIKNMNILNKIQEKQPQVNDSFEFPDPCFLSGIDQPPRKSRVGTLNLDRIGTPAKSMLNESSAALLPDKIRCIDILDQASGMLQDLQQEEKEIKMMADECDKNHQKVEDLYMNLKKVDYVNSGVLQIMYNYQKKAVAEQRKEQSSVIAEYHDLKEKNIAVRHKTETQVIKSLFKRLKQKRKNILQSIS